MKSALMNTNLCIYLCRPIMYILNKLYMYVCINYVLCIYVYVRTYIMCASIMHKPNVKLLTSC